MVGNSKQKMSTKTIAFSTLKGTTKKRGRNWLVLWWMKGFTVTTWLNVFKSTLFICYMEKLWIFFCFLYIAYFCVDVKRDHARNIKNFLDMKQFTWYECVYRQIPLREEKKKIVDFHEKKFQYFENHKKYQMNRKLSLPQRKSRTFALKEVTIWMCEIELYEIKSTEGNRINKKSWWKITPYLLKSNIDKIKEYSYRNNFMLWWNILNNDVNVFSH